jgi:hypothetical protein
LQIGKRDRKEQGEMSDSDSSNEERPCEEGTQLDCEEDNSLTESNGSVIDPAGEELVNKIADRSNGSGAESGGGQKTKRTEAIKRARKGVAKKRKSSASAKRSKPKTNKNVTEYEDSGEEEEDEEEEVKKKKPQRKKQVLCNDAMDKNLQGKVEISKIAFDPEKQVTEENVKLLLGSKCIGNGMKDGEFQSIFDWYVQLKACCMYWMRGEAITAVFQNVTTFQYDFSKVKELSEAWYNATEQDAQLNMAEVLFNIFNTGVLKNRGEEWKLDMEAKFMDEHNLVYIDKENLKECIGCIAKAATAAKGDIKSNVERKGNKRHGLQVSTRGPNLEKKEDFKRSRIRKGTEFDQSFIRPMTKAKNGHNMRNSGRTTQQVANPLSNPVASTPGFLPESVLVPIAANTGSFLTDVIALSSEQLARVSCFVCWFFFFGIHGF